MDKVCTIIVTYNGAKWIEKCLQHLLHSKYSSTVIVIDNHSTDNTIDILQKYLPHIELIRNEKNLGFGGGNNIGIKRALALDANFIFLLNQDVYINETTIGSLITTLKENPSFGIISPLQLDSDNIHLEKTFKKYIPEAEMKNILQPDFQFRSHKPISLRFVNAAAWMITRQAVEKVGLFHPVFFHYGEDNNYSSRLQYHDLNIGVSDCTRVIHDRNKETPLPEKFLRRNLKTIPLYTLVDIRKPLIVAYLLGLLKLKRIKKKLEKYHPNDIQEIYQEQKKWFTSGLRYAIQIRRETKRVYYKA